jgi:uncharacterized protein
MTSYRVAEHKIIRADGSDFVFLAADKAIFATDAATKEILSKWSIRRHVDSQQLLADLPDLSGNERQDFIRGLLQRRVILPVNDLSPGATVAGVRPGCIPLKTLILHVTDACNLNCGYCYQRADRSASGGAHPMGNATARKAVDFLMERSDGLQDVVLVFFGGEPLLNFAVISATVDYARQKAAAKGKRVDFALTTNGTLLTTEMIDFLQAQQLSVTVSLDGWEQIHDRFRRFADGRPSYRVIRENVQRLLRRSPNRPAVARVTLAQNAENVSEILDHLLALGFVEVGFAPVTTGHPEFQLSDRNMDRLLEQFRRLAGDFCQAALEGRFRGFSNVIDLLVSLHQGEVMNYPCGAGLGLFAVAPEGQLYLCQRFTGDERYCMGSISEGFDREKLERFRNEAEIRNKAACRECWVRTVCTGGCYHEACVREGSHLQPNRHYCDWIKRWTEIGLEVYCRLASSRPEFLDMLCASRGY